jgi:DNA processing protein
MTARTALDQGREVLAVPGHPFDARAAGCNLLIRDGATLVRGAEDVIEAIGAALRSEGPALRPEGPAARRVPRAVPPALRAEPAPGPARAGDLPDRILACLGPSPLAEDQLIRDLGLPPAHVLPELLTLELVGRIRRQPGGLVSLAD